MFEMKNESDTTATKKKNEDFLKELDKDRTEKGCEYAVLVSLLEPDNELYNLRLCRRLAPLPEDVRGAAAVLLVRLSPCCATPPLARCSTSASSSW